MIRLRDIRLGDTMGAESRAAAWTAAVALAALGATSAALAQNAATAIANASKSMGVDGLNSVTYYGSGPNYGAEQQRKLSVAARQRQRLSPTIDFTKPALLSTGQTYEAWARLGKCHFGARTESRSADHAPRGARDARSLS
jgi:hypothetical protein